MARLKRGFSVLVALAAFATSGAHAQPEEEGVRLVVPDSLIEDASRQGQPNVFGTIALPVRAKPTSTRWSKVMNASLDQPGLIELTEEARALSPLDQAAFVQIAINDAVHSPAISQDCSDDGYWAPAEETLARGLGDCFDLVVAKMEALRLLGVAPDDMFLTTGYSGRPQASGRGRGSAALLVRIDDRFVLLGEERDYVLPADESTPDFVPVVTYGTNRTWVHGRLVKVASLAAAGNERAR